MFAVYFLCTSTRLSPCQTLDHKHDPVLKDLIVKFIQENMKECKIIHTISNFHATENK